MRELGKDATSSGALESVTYGSPGVPEAWDADRIFGCSCDPEYTGYDCSRRVCPVGDDPLTPGSAEVQVLVCDAASGTFTLSFRSEHGACACCVTTAATDRPRPLTHAASRPSPFYPAHRRDGHGVRPRRRPSRLVLRFWCRSRRDRLGYGQRRVDPLRRWWDHRCPRDLYGRVWGPA